MTVTPTHNTDLWRVQLVISDFPNGTALVERSANQIAWQTVRGGTALPIVSGAGSLDDYEYFASADGSLTTFYRVSSASLEDTVDVFTADGTWNKPAGLVAAKVTVVAPGGAGGGATTTAAGESSAGSGGNAGGLAVAVIPAASLGATETVTIGLVGAGSAGANGGNGGSASFGTHAVATGGQGGAVGGASTSTIPTSPSGDAGVGTTGDLLVTGGQGSFGFRSPTLARGGNGGAGAFGGGASNTTGNSDGSNGTAPGSGGSGASNAPSQGTARAGGDGAPGVVIVEHFFAGEGP